MTRSRPTADILQRVENLNGSDINNDLNWVDSVQAGQAAPVQNILAGTGIGVTVNPATKEYLITNLGGGGGLGVQSDWNETDVLSLAYIQNKPSDLNEFTNSPGYITAAQVPVQDIVGGSGISVSSNNGTYTVTSTVQQVQSDWSMTVASDPAYIKNKPTNVSEFANDSGYLTLGTVPVKDIQAGANTKVTSINGVYTVSAIVDNVASSQSDWLESDNQAISYIKNKPTDISEWTNDVGYITAADIPADAVTSVNSKTGAVVLNAADVGALPDNTAIPTKTSDLTNDSGFVDAAGAAAAAPVQNIVAGTNVTVSESLGVFTINAAGGGGGGAVDSVNGQTGVVVLDASDVGALPDSTSIPTHTSNLTNDSGYITAADIPPDAVDSVNGQTGVVVLDAADVGALPDNTAIPANTSDLTNDGEGAGNGPFIDVIGLGDALTDYLPLAGGTMTGALRAWAGSAVLPGLSWDGDVDTGIYHSGADSLSFSTGGSLRGTVNPDGTWYFRQNVGVGTTPSGSIGLNIGGSVSSNSTFGISVGYTYSTSMDSAYGIAARPLPAFGASITTFVGMQARAPSGLGGVVNYIGFQAEPGVAGTTSHYGFHSQVAAETGKTRYGFFADGDAQNRFDGPVLFADGTASVPSAAFTSDENTGVFRPAADTLAYATGGVERMRIGPEGSLGIGVAATSTNQRVRFNASIGGATTAWEVRATGQVQADVTSDGIYFGTAASTVAGATTPRLTHFYATSGSVAATVPLQVGFWATSTMTGAQQNHGFRSDMADTGTNYNIYVGGAAPSYFNGNVGFGTNTPETELAVNGVGTFSFGSAAAPSIVFRGTADTGIFSPATDTFAISTAGTERLRVGATGQITAAAGYTPTTGRDLATKAYVDAGDAVTDFRSVPDGTPAAPAIAFAADKTTGIFRETATDCWCVSVGGQKRFEIDTVGDCYTSGWLGIATPDDATSPLDVNGDSLRLRVSKTPATETEAAAEGTIAWDDDFLWIRTATVWKKTPWYSFGSSGGGSGPIVPPPGIGAGANWTRSLNLGFVAGFRVLAANGLFYLYDKYSTDGLTWTQVTGNSAIQQPSDRRLAVGNGVMMTSTAYSYDATSWTNFSITADGPALFHNGKFYLSRPGTNAAYVGTGPSNMSAEVLAYWPGASGYAESDGTNIVAIANSSSSVIRVQDPATDAGSNTLTMNGEVKGLAYAPSMGASGTFACIDDGFCYLSSDGGQTWSTHVLPTSADWAGLAWNGTRFCAVASPNGANVAIYSDDGINWTISNSIDNATGTVGIAGSNGRFVAGGDLNSVPGDRGVNVSGN